jgi:hypothetical protein
LCVSRIVPFTTCYVGNFIVTTYSYYNYKHADQLFGSITKKPVNTAHNTYIVETAVLATFCNFSEKDLLLPKTDPDTHNDDIEKKILKVADVLHLWCGKKTVDYFLSYRY